MEKQIIQSSCRVIGRDAEHYIMSLFDMYKCKDGSLKPDLVSGESYDPFKLFLEVKSALKSPVIKIYQAGYLAFKKSQGELFNINKHNYEFYELPKRTSFYYNLITRNDKLNFNNFFKPYSTTQIIWGDQIILPHQVIFAYLLRHLQDRMGLDEDMALEELIMQIESRGTKSAYLNLQDMRESEFKKDISPIDWVVLFENKLDLSANIKITTEKGKKRIKNLNEQLKGLLDYLVPIKIEGPKIYLPEQEITEKPEVQEYLFKTLNKKKRNEQKSQNTIIRALVMPEDMELFDKVLRNIIYERMPFLEDIIQQRLEKAKELLSKIRTTDKNENDYVIEGNGFSFGGNCHYTFDDLIKEEIACLRKLSDYGINSEGYYNRPVETEIQPF